MSSEPMESPERFTGPLAGIRIVEVGSIGPGPFCAMLLSDLGADIIRLDRLTGAGLVGPNDNPRAEILNRGRRSVAFDLKHPAGRDVLLELVEQADALIEGFRPGVMERLGVGPGPCLERNPRLVYGRMTGYGQDGPMAQTVGHDINYVAMSGVLSLIGRAGQPPTPPLSLVGDFGGGGMMLALGILAALLEQRRSGAGQVIDAAMTEGAALLGTPFQGFVQSGTWSTERGHNMVDSGAPYYDAYECADGKWLSVAGMEPRFYADLLTLLGLDGPDQAGLPDQLDQSAWPAMKTLFADTVRTRNRDDWVERASGLNPCVAPVLEPDEVAEHPHHVARGTFFTSDGIVQSAPVPKFSRTSAQVDRRPPLPGEHTVAALTDWGVDPARVSAWRADGVIAANDQSEVRA